MQLNIVTSQPMPKLLDTPLFPLSLFSLSTLKRLSKRMRLHSRTTNPRKRAALFLLLTRQICCSLFSR